MQRPVRLRLLLQPLNRIGLWKAFNRNWLQLVLILRLRARRLSNRWQVPDHSNFIPQPPLFWRFILHPLHLFFLLPVNFLKERILFPFSLLQFPFPLLVTEEPLLFQPFVDEDLVVEVLNKNAPLAKVLRPALLGPEHVLAPSPIF